MIPLYQGLSWPYITASSEAVINKESNITAVIEVTGSGYVTSSNLPLYQYNLDHNLKICIQLLQAINGMQYYQMEHLQRT